MAREADGVFTARAPAALAPVGSDYVYLLPGVGPRPDPVSRRQPYGVHGPSRIVATGRLSLERRRVARPAARRAHLLRAARRDVLARRNLRRRRREAPPPARPRRHRDRADAGGDLSRRSQLGLRRRVAVRPARIVRRTRGAARPGGCLPCARAGAVPRRRLQPPRTGGELPPGLRPVLHRSLQDALGRGAQLRRARQRRGAPLLRRQRAPLADGLSRRRAAPRRHPRHLRLRRAAHSRRDLGRVSRRGGAARAPRLAGGARAI